MHFLLALLFSLSAYAAPCEPEINVLTTEIATKEGHKDQVKLIDVGVEMDRLCPGETVTLKLLVISGSAVVGEHVQSYEINTLSIPAGSAVAMMSIGIIGDNEWNEAREFRIRAINPNLGWVNMAETLVTIQNDDPLITFVAPNSVREPKKGKKQVPLKIELDMPAEQRITGEVLIKGVTTDEEDVIGEMHLGFEMLPGDTYFEFLPNSLSVLADDKREKSEQLSFEIITVKGATPSPARSFMTVLDPAPALELTFKSVLKAMMEGQVGMTSTYSHKLVLESSDEDEATYVATPSKPNYSHIVPAMPFPITTTPGLLGARIVKADEALSKVRIEFVEAPTERYAMNPYTQYLFMSSFGALHRSEMVTAPEEKSLYAMFDLKAVKPAGKGKWLGSYKQNLTEDGVEVLRETTEITIVELND